MEYIIAGVVALVALGIGVLIGQKMAAAQSSGKLQSLEQEVAFKQQKIDDLDKEKQVSKEENDRQIEQVQKEREAIRDEKEKLALQVNSLQSNNDHLNEKLTEQKKELTELQEKFTKEFENLANKILDQKSEKVYQSQ